MGMWSLCDIVFSKDYKIKRHTNFDILESHYEKEIMVVVGFDDDEKGYINIKCRYSQIKDFSTKNG